MLFTWRGCWKCCRNVCGQQARTWTFGLLHSVALLRCNGKRRIANSLGLPLDTLCYLRRKSFLMKIRAD